MTGGRRGLRAIETLGPRVRLKFLKPARQELQQVLPRVQLLDPLTTNLRVILIVGRDGDLLGHPLLQPTPAGLLALDPVGVVRPEQVLRRLRGLQLHNLDDEAQRNREIRAALANVPHDPRHPLRLGRAFHAVVVAQHPGKRGDHLGTARVVGHPPQELEQALRHYPLAVTSGKLLDSLQNFTAVRERVVAGALEEREQVVQLYIREFPRERREEVQHVVLDLLEGVLLLGNRPQLVDVRLGHGILLEQEPEDGGHLVHVLLVVQVRRAEDVGQHLLRLHPSHDALELLLGPVVVARLSRLLQRSLNLAQRLELHVKRGDLQHRLYHRLVHLRHPPRSHVPRGFSPFLLQRVRQNLLQVPEHLGQVHVSLVAFAAVGAHELGVRGANDAQHVVQAPIRLLREIAAKAADHGPRRELRGSSRVLQHRERNRPGVAQQTQDPVPSPVSAEAVADLIQPRVDLHVASRPGIVVPARIDEGVSGGSGALAGKPHGHGGGIVVVAHVDHPVVVLPAKVRLELVRAVHRPFLARIGVHEGSGLRLGDGDRRGERALERLELVRDSVKPVLLMVLAVPIERPREGVEEVAHVDLVLLPLLVRAGAGEVVRLVQLDGDELREAHRRGEDVRVNVPRPSAKVVEREAPLERVRDEVAVQLPDVFAAE